MGMEVLWIRNTDGKKDVMLTFAFVSLSIVLIKVLFGGIPFEILGSTYMLTPIDAATIGALLTPTLVAYVGRRYTDRKFRDENFDGIDDREEMTDDVAPDYHHLVVGDDDPLPRPMNGAQDGFLR